MRAPFSLHRGSSGTDPLAAASVTGMDTTDRQRVRSALQVLSDAIGMNDGVRTTRIVAEEHYPQTRPPSEPWAVKRTNKLGDFWHVRYAKKAAQRQVDDWCAPTCSVTVTIRLAMVETY